MITFPQRTMARMLGCAYMPALLQRHFCGVSRVVADTKLYSGLQSRCETLVYRGS